MKDHGSPQACSARQSFCCVMFSLSKSSSKAVILLLSTTQFNLLRVNICAFGGYRSELSKVVVFKTSIFYFPKTAVDLIPASLASDYCLSTVSSSRSNRCHRLAREELRTFCFDRGTDHESGCCIPLKYFSMASFCKYWLVQDAVAKFTI